MTEEAPKCEICMYDLTGQPEACSRICDECFNNQT